ncbi:MAG: MFS transporter [Gaiellaceae bacterium]
MEAATRARALSAFRSRDFRLLWGGQTVSFAGDTAFLVAIGWYVTTLTGSAGSLGLVLALQSAALLTTLLIGGVIADRYPRRRLMIGSDLARALLVGILAALDATGRLSFTRSSCSSR